VSPLSIRAMASRPSFAKDGREAIALMDSGLTQVSAAAHLGITKQAMSKRLLTAGWHAELAGRRLAERLLVRLQP